MVKLSQDEYFMKIAEVVKERSGCIKRKVGAVLVKDNRILSSGYNQTSKGYINCENGGCSRCSSNSKPGENLDECLCVHAEINCVLSCALEGVSTKGSTLYTTFSCCIYCCKELINAGITEVVYKEEYPGIEKVKELFKHCGIKFRKINNVTLDNF